MSEEKSTNDLCFLREVGTVRCVMASPAKTRGPEATKCVAAGDCCGSMYGGDGMSLHITLEWSRVYALHLFYL